MDRVFYAILFYFVDYGIPLSEIKIVLFIIIIILYWIKHVSLLEAGRWFLGNLVFSTNKTDHPDTDIPGIYIYLFNASVFIYLQSMIRNIYT
jgi:hypothetical protein